MVLPVAGWYENVADCHKHSKVFWRRTVGLLSCVWHNSAKAQEVSYGVSIGEDQSLRLMMVGDVGGSDVGKLEDMPDARRRKS